MTARCIGYKYKTFRKNCSLCGESLISKSRKYLIHYGDKFMTDVLCSKVCRDRAIEEKVKDIMEDKKLYAISFVDDGGIRLIMGKTDRGHTIALKVEDIKDQWGRGLFYFHIYDSVMAAKEDFKLYTKPTDYEFEVIELEKIIKPVVVGYKIKE